MSADQTDHEDGAPDLGWAVDAAVGAAARVARTANTIGGSIGGSGAARFLTGTARKVARPLSREGEQVRQQIEHDAVPTAQRVVRQVTPRVMDAVDIDAILGAIDIDAILDRIDLDRVISRLDIGKIVASLDLNALMEHIDLNALLQRIDLDALVGSIDLDALLENLDVDSLVQNTELGGLIAKSTSGIASSALDGVRAQGVGLDGFVDRWTQKVLRRDLAALPAGPPKLVDPPRPALPPVETNGGTGADQPSGD